MLCKLTRIFGDKFVIRLIVYLQINNNKKEKGGGGEKEEKQHFI